MTPPTAPVVALVPTRSPGAGKSRLAPRLDAQRRAALGAAMLADVVAALEASPVDRLVVAAAGSAAADVARALGVEVHRDPPEANGLDAAVAAAVAGLPDTAGVLVVMADLPCLTPGDVSALLASDGDVVVAANDDGGTGGLLRRPAAAIATAYGEGSADRHVELAEQAGLTVRLLRLPGFAFDVDTADDLDRLRTLRVGAHTAAFLARPGGHDAAVVAPDLNGTTPTSPRW